MYGSERRDRPVHIRKNGGSLRLQIYFFNDHHVNWSTLLDIAHKSEEK